MVLGRSEEEDVDGGRAVEGLGLGLRLEMGIMEKRCLSFEATMAFSSGNVIFRDLRARVFNFFRFLTR